MEVVKNSVISVKNLQKIPDNKLNQEIREFIQNDILTNNVTTTFDETVSIEDIEAYEIYQMNPIIYGCRIIFNKSSDNVGRLWYNIKNN